MNLGVIGRMAFGGQEGSAVLKQNTNTTGKTNNSGRFLICLAQGRKASSCG